MFRPDLKKKLQTERNHAEQHKITNKIVNQALSPQNQNIPIIQQESFLLGRKVVKNDINKQVNIVEIQKQQIDNKNFQNQAYSTQYTNKISSNTNQYFRNTFYQTNSTQMSGKMSNYQQQQQMQKTHNNRFYSPDAYLQQQQIYQPYMEQQQQKINQNYQKPSTSSGIPKWNHNQLQFQQNFENEQLQKHIIDQDQKVDILPSSYRNKVFTEKFFFKKNPNKKQGDFQQQNSKNNKSKIKNTEISSQQTNQNLQEEQMTTTFTSFKQLNLDTVLDTNQQQSHTSLSSRNNYNKQNIDFQQQTYVQQPLSTRNQNAAKLNQQQKFRRTLFLEENQNNVKKQRQIGDISSPTTLVELGSTQRNTLVSPNSSSKQNLFSNRSPLSSQQQGKFIFPSGQNSSQRQSDHKRHQSNPISFLQNQQFNKHFQSEQQEKLQKLSSHENLNILSEQDQYQKDLLSPRLVQYSNNLNSLQFSQPFVKHDSPLQKKMSNLQQFQDKNKQLQKKMENKLLKNNNVVFLCIKDVDLSEIKKKQQLQYCYQTFFIENKLLRKQQVEKQLEEMKEKIKKALHYQKKAKVYLYYKNGDQIEHPQLDPFETTIIVSLNPGFQGITQRPQKFSILNNFLLPELEHNTLLQRGLEKVIDQRLQTTQKTQRTQQSQNQNYGIEQKSDYKLLFNKKYQENYMYGDKKLENNKINSKKQQNKNNNNKQSVCERQIEEKLIQNQNKSPEQSIITINTKRNTNFASGQKNDENNKKIKIFEEEILSDNVNTIDNIINTLQINEVKMEDRAKHSYYEGIVELPIYLGPKTKELLKKERQQQKQSFITSKRERNQKLQEQINLNSNDLQDMLAKIKQKNMIRAKISPVLEQKIDINNHNFNLLHPQESGRSLKFASNYDIKTRNNSQQKISGKQSMKSDWKYKNKQQYVKHNGVLKKTQKMIDLEIIDKYYDEQLKECKKEPLEQGKEDRYQIKKYEPSDKITRLLKGRSKIKIIAEEMDLFKPQTPPKQIRMYTPREDKQIESMVALDKKQKEQLNKVSQKTINLNPKDSDEFESEQDISDSDIDKDSDSEMSSVEQVSSQENLNGIPKFNFLIQEKHEDTNLLTVRDLDEDKHQKKKEKQQQEQQAIIQKQNMRQQLAQSKGLGKMIFNSQPMSPQNSRKNRMKEQVSNILEDVIKVQQQSPKQQLIYQRPSVVQQYNWDEVSKAHFQEQEKIKKSYKKKKDELNISIDNNIDQVVENKEQSKKFQSEQNSQRLLNNLGANMAVSQQHEIKTSLFLKGILDNSQPRIYEHKNKSQASIGITDKNSDQEQIIEKREQVQKMQESTIYQIRNIKQIMDKYEVDFPDTEVEQNNLITKNKESLVNKKEVIRRIDNLNINLQQLNIPQIMKDIPNYFDDQKKKNKEITSFTRNDIHQIYTIYKALHFVTSQRQKPQKYTIEDGVDYETYRNGIYQVYMQSEEMAKKIFQTIDYNFSGFIDWEEFIKLMVSIRAKTLPEKINLFIKIADDDGNGSLSWDEIYELARICLSKYISEDKDGFLDMLCDYFTKLIFNTVNIKLDQEIPLELIKHTIINSTNADGDLLCMFCGADI